MAGDCLLRLLCVLQINCNICILQISCNVPAYTSGMVCGFVQSERKARICENMNIYQIVCFMLYAIPC